MPKTQKLADNTHDVVQHPIFAIVANHVSYKQSACYEPYLTEPLLTRYETITIRGGLCSNIPTGNVWSVGESNQANCHQSFPAALDIKTSVVVRCPAKTHKVISAVEMLPKTYIRTFRIHRDSVMQKQLMYVPTGL